MHFPICVDGRTAPGRGDALKYLRVTSANERALTERRPRGGAGDISRLTGLLTEIDRRVGVY